ncbi:MAG: hypothetical protein R6V45_03870 [Oceanipulchritudo sp.]
MTTQPESQSLFLASIALEPNRWKKPAERIPSLRVSEWSPRARAAGFHGWELWEDHYFGASERERAALADAALPVRVFNTYARPGIDPAERLEAVVAAVRFLGSGVRGIKFNLGKAEEGPLRSQVEAAARWSEQFPVGVRLLCECHPGTLLEDPRVAAEAFRQWPVERFGAIIHPMNPDPAYLEAWFGELGGRIVHLHWQARDGGRNPVLLKDLPCRLEAVRETLRRRGFVGTHSIEFVKGLGQPGESVPDLFEAAAEDGRTLLAAKG